MQQVDNAFATEATLSTTRKNKDEEKCPLFNVCLYVDLFLKARRERLTVSMYLFPYYKLFMNFFTIYKMNETETGFGSAVLMFNWVEYSVFCTMLLLSLLIGVYFGWFKRQDTVAEYMLGGKTMSVMPVMLSLVFRFELYLNIKCMMPLLAVVKLTSALVINCVTLLGIPAEIYQNGTQYCSIAVANIAVLFINNYLFLPVFFELQLTSLYEYLELRFDKETRSLASLIFAISLIIFIPVVIYVPALAFNQVTGVSIHIITPIVCVICIFYTSFGGLKAVVWTDALQSLFTLGSSLFIIFIGFYKVGSISEVWRINEEGGRLEFFNMNPSLLEPNTFCSFFIGMVFFWLAQITVHPGAVQRFISVSSFDNAKMVMIWSCIFFFIIKGSSVVIGLLLYAHYHDCDPIATKIVKKAGQLLPLYVIETAQEFPGLTGLFISGVLSAALSTMSAGLNTVAGTLYEDFQQYVLKGKKQSDSQQSFAMKLIVLVLGVIFILLVFVVEKLGALFQMAVSLIGVTSGALVGVFSLGVFVPRANAKGAKWGAAVSLIVMAVIVFGTQFYIASGMLKIEGKRTSVAGCPVNFTANLAFNASALVSTYTGIGSPLKADESVPTIFKFSYLYYSFLGTIVVFLVGLPVSYLSESPDLSTLDPRLFCPYVRSYLPPQRQSEYILVNSNPTSQHLQDT